MLLLLPNFMPAACCQGFTSLLLLLQLWSPIKSREALSYAASAKGVQSAQEVHS